MIKQLEDLQAIIDYSTTLENENKNYKSQNANLIQQNQTIASENEQLKSQIEQLESQKVTEREKKIAEVIARAKAYMDIKIPYKFGGEYKNDQALDCSAFMRACFYPYIWLERASRDQAKEGILVDRENLEAGDMLFFDTNKDGIINHVGLYIGDGKIIHTAKAGEGIIIDDWQKRYGSSFVTARRIFE